MPARTQCNAAQRRVPWFDLELDSAPSKGMAVGVGECVRRRGVLLLCCDVCCGDWLAGWNE